MTLQVGVKENEDEDNQYTLIWKCKKIIQKELFENGVRTAIPEELPCTSYSSNLWNVKNWAE